MSGLVGAALPQFIQRPADKSCLDDYYGGEAEIATPLILDLLSSEGLEFEQDYVTPWWPGSSFAVNDTGISDVLWGNGWDDPWIFSGCNARLGFVGITRDQYGSPLGGCTVRCFRTSNSELVYQTVSDITTGEFLVTSPYTDGHFLVVHKTGTPDVCGASVDTLTPS